MINTFHLKAIASAAGIAAAMLVAVPAHAYTYATSHLNLNDLTLVASLGSVTVTSYTFNLTNTATLNGASVIQTATCNSLANNCSAASPVLDAAPANAPGGAPVRANNDFSFIGFGGATPYSNADSVISTAQLVQGVPTSTRQIAESLLTGSGAAAATTVVQSNSTLAFQLNVVGGTNLALNFMADPDLRAAIMNLVAGSGSAQADMSATFTLRNNASGGSVQWSPTGTGTNDCVVSNLAGTVCSETADTFTLNTNVGTGTNNTDVQSNFEAGDLFGAFGINITGIPDGTYSLILSANTSTSIVQVIPEPGTMALMGLALLGVGVAGNRKRQMGSKA